MPEPKDHKSPYPNAIRDTFGYFDDSAGPDINDTFRRGLIIGHITMFSYFIPGYSYLDALRAYIHFYRTSYNWITEHKPFPVHLLPVAWQDDFLNLMTEEEKELCQSR